MSKINESGGADVARKKVAMIGAAGVVSLTLLFLADSLMEWGLVDSILSVAGVTETHVEPVPEVQPPSLAEGAPVLPRAKQGSRAEKEKDSEKSSDEVESAYLETVDTSDTSALKTGAKRSPLLKPNSSETAEKVSDALDNIASWEAVDGAYPEGSLLGYLQHKKTWVSLGALAFAIETGVYSRAFLEARAKEITSRSKPALVRRFSQRYRKTKPAVYAELSSLLALSGR